VARSRGWRLREPEFGLNLYSPRIVVVIVTCILPNQGFCGVITGEMLTLSFHVHWLLKCLGWVRWGFLHRVVGWMALRWGRHRKR
jgi:hypothetical protein